MCINSAAVSVMGEPSVTLVMRLTDAEPAPAKPPPLPVLTPTPIVAPAMIDLFSACTVTLPLSLMKLMAKLKPSAFRAATSRSSLLRGPTWGCVSSNAWVGFNNAVPVEPMTTAGPVGLPLGTSRVPARAGVSGARFYFAECAI